MIIYKDLFDKKEDYIIITKSDVENLGKKTLKDVYNILNIDWSDLYNKELITEIKKERDKLDNYLINSIINSDNIENKKSYIKKKIENKSFHIDIIFNALSVLNLTWDMNEDAYCQNKEFLNIYNIFNHYI